MQNWRICGVYFFVRKMRSLNRLTPWHPPSQISRVVIIQDYDDKKKQYHNLEKGYLVHGEPARFLISRPQSACELSSKFKLQSSTSGLSSTLDPERGTLNRSR